MKLKSFVSTCLLTTLLAVTGLPSAWAQKKEGLSTRSQKTTTVASGPTRTQKDINKEKLDEFWAERLQRGGDSSGGGDVFLCQKKKGAKRGSTFLADSYGLTYLGLLYWDQGVPAAALLATYTSLLTKHNPEVGAEVERVLATLEFTPTDEKLPELDDDNLTPPPGCKKAQLALQHIPSGKVLYNREYHDFLTPIEQVLFRIHEAFIAIRNQPGEDTTPIRAEVEKIAGDAGFIDFLAQTIYRQRIVPEFWFQASYMKMVSFWIMGLLMETHHEAFCTYVASPSAFRSLKTGAMNSMDFNARIIETGNLMSAMTGTISGIGLGEFTGAYESSLCVVDFAFRLQQKQQKTRKWIKVEEVKIAEIKEHIDQVFSCLGRDKRYDRLRDIEPIVREDFAKYQSWLEAYRADSTQAGNPPVPVEVSATAPAAPPTQ